MASARHGAPGLPRQLCGQPVRPATRSARRSRPAALRSPPSRRQHAPSCWHLASVRRHSPRPARSSWPLTVTRVSSTRYAGDHQIAGAQPAVLLDQPQHSLGMGRSSKHDRGRWPVPMGPSALQFFIDCKESTKMRPAWLARTTRLARSEEQVRGRPPKVPQQRKTARSEKPLSR